MNLFKEYTRTQAVDLERCHRDLQRTSKCFETVGKVAEMLNDKTVNGLLTKVFSKSVADRLLQVGNFAKLIGPVGSAVGVTCDVLRIAGVVLSDDKTLDTLSSQIETLSADLKNELKEMRALQRVSHPCEYLLAAVETFEKNLPPGNEESFWKRLSCMVEYHSPDKIIENLKLIHNAVVGNGIFDGSPLFKELFETGKPRKHEEQDEFIATILMQFQGLLALQIRAFRMLRSMVTYCRQDLAYQTDLIIIIEDIATQNKEYDPFKFVEWYLNIKVFGGVFTISPASDPTRHISFINPNHPARVIGTPINLLTGTYASKCPKGYSGDPDNTGKLIVAPHQGGTYLISSIEWPNRHMYMKESVSVYPHILAKDGDPGPQGHWKLYIHDYDKRLFVLRPAKWPKWYMYMRIPLANHDIRGARGNPNESGHFTLTHVQEYTEQYRQYMSIKVHGGSFVVQSKKWPNEYLYVRDDGNISRSTAKGDPAGIFIFKPQDDGSFIITTKKSHPVRMYMQDNWKGSVKVHPNFCSSSKDADYWYVIYDFVKSDFMLSPKKWPNWYICTKEIHEVQGSKSPGEEGHFILEKV